MLRHAVYGLLMGSADVIPGVSGGTVALIVGIYERLIAAIAGLAGAAAVAVRGDVRAAVREVRAVPWGFLLPLGGGILAALAAGSVVIPVLLDRFAWQTAALFFGLIVGSLSVPWRRIGRPGAPAVATVAVAALAAFAVTGLPVLVSSDPGLPRVFASAAVAICAMILPGVSGAFLLLVLGAYEPTLHAARALDVAYLTVFAAGAALGLGLFSRTLRWLLERRHDATMAALVGLMIGSLRRLWPWGGSEGDLLAPPSGGEALAGAGLCLLGVLLVRGLLAVDRSARSADQPAVDV